MPQLLVLTSTLALVFALVTWLMQLDLLALAGLKIDCDFAMFVLDAGGTSPSNVASFLEWLIPMTPFVLGLSSGEQRCRHIAVVWLKTADVIQLFVAAQQKMHRYYRPMLAHLS